MMRRANETVSEFFFSLAEQDMINMQDQYINVS